MNCIIVFIGEISKMIYTKKDFKEYDFSEKSLKKLLQESILATLEKDDEEKIKVKSYSYFKTTLTNKINDFRTVKSKKSKRPHFDNSNMVVSDMSGESVNIIDLDDDYILKKNNEKWA